MKPLQGQGWPAEDGEVSGAGLFSGPLPQACAHSGEAAQDFHFAVRYRTPEVGGGLQWFDYSLHPASKLGLHNAMLAVHDRIEVLQARRRPFACGLFVIHAGVAEPLSQDGAERLFATLPHGDVKWIDLCRCLLPPVPAGGGRRAADLAAAPRIALAAPHTHTGYDDLEAHSTQHLLDIEA